MGRRWGTWEAMDETERWWKKEKDPDGDSRGNVLHGSRSQVR